MLLQRTFTVSRLAIGIEQSHLKMILLLSTVNLVLLTSFFWRHTLETMHPFVMSFHLSLGTSPLWVKTFVVVPSFWPGIPLQSLPILFPKECPNYSLYFGLFMRCLYSGSSAVSPPMTAHANSVMNSRGNLHLEACLVDSLRPEMLKALRRYCCLVALVLLT